MEFVQNSLIAKIRNFFAKAGISQVDVAILQPAEPFLDSVGEDLRRRIFMTENEYGEVMCLRPEFTIPVCLAHIKSGETLPHHYAYVGEVFRQHRIEGRNSFYQAGIEHLGEMDEVKADAASLVQAFTLLCTVAPGQNFQILTGDHSMFDAVLSALDLKEGWQWRLRNCFGNKPRLHATLDDLSKPPPPMVLPTEIAQALANHNEQILTNLLEAQMYENGLPLHFSRSGAEIAQRLIEKHALMQQPLDPRRVQILKTFLNIHIPLSQACDTIAMFAKENGLDLDNALAKFEARITTLRRSELAAQNILYDSAFGRSLDYYTGFIYEIRQGDQVLAGGGRYDHLLHLLGASMPIPAVGFSLWLDRLEQLV